MASILQLRERCKEPPAPCEPATHGWSLAVDMRLVVQLVAEVAFAEADRDTFMLLWRSVCWASWHMVTSRTEQQLPPNPEKILCASPFKMLALARLPPCVVRMLECDGLSTPTFRLHALGLQQGGQTAAAIADHVQRYIDVVDVLRRLQSGEAVPGTSTELAVRIRCSAPHMRTLHHTLPLTLFYLVFTDSPTSWSTPCLWSPHLYCLKLAHPRLSTHKALSGWCHPQCL